MKLTNKEEALILTYHHINESSGCIVLVGGSLNLKLRGLITRECGDLDIIVDSKVVATKSNKLSTKLYDFNFDDTKMNEHMNRLGVLMPLGRDPTLKPVCLFYREFINLHSTTVVRYNDKKIYLQSIDEVVAAKEYYGEFSTSLLVRKKHNDDLIILKLTQFI